MKHNLCFKCGEHTLAPRVMHDKDGFVSIAGYDCKCGARVDIKYKPDEYRCVSCGKKIVWAKKQGTFDCPHCQAKYHAD